MATASAVIASSVAVDSAPAGTSVPAPADAIPAAGPDLGREQIEQDTVEEEPDVVSATVAEVWKGGNRMLYFQFTTGQIWRQMESGYFFYPKEQEFEVTIRQGMMGEYKMRLAGRARTTRIIRVK